jgi:hypothetical protein
MCALTASLLVIRQAETRSVPVMPNSAKPTSAPGIEIPAAVQSLPGN